MKTDNWEEMCKWFHKIVHSDEGRIKNLSDKGYDNWLLSLFYLAGVDKIDTVMKKKKGVEVLQKVIELAYHEAGHAIFVWRQGWHFDHYGIILNPDDGSGFCSRTWMKVEERRNSLYKYVQPPYVDYQAEVEFLMAGVAAENRIRSHYSKERCRLENSYMDYDNAFGVLDRYCKIQEKDAEKFIRKIYYNVSRLLKHPKTWEAVTAIAEALLKFNYLNYETAFEIISGINPPRKITDKHHLVD